LFRKAPAGFIGERAERGEHAQIRVADLLIEHSAGGKN
jgi:hypothetical protein